MGPVFGPADRPGEATFGALELREDVGGARFEEHLPSRGEAVREGGITHESYGSLARHEQKAMLSHCLSSLG